MPRDRPDGPLALAAAAGVIALALMQPNHPASATWGALRIFPLELPMLLAALALARGRPARALRVGVAAALTLMVALKAADLASNIAFQRPYNPLLDLHLAAAGWRLLTGAIGALTALAAIVALVTTLALAAGALWWATGRFAAADPPPALRAPLGLALAVSAALVVADAAREASPIDPPGVAFTTRLAWEHARDAAAARADLAAFRRAAAEDPLAALPPEETLTALQGTDILLIFVESYGRTTLESPRFAPAAAATLAEIEARLAAAGLAMRSGYLDSPTLGGQSWLAHATLLSGLVIDNQGRYRALMASPRRTLLGLAQGAGWRSVAVAPAITLAWPEAAWFGYDRVLAAADLGYAGKPFNWVTMPDQFTLAAFERAELDLTPRPPVIAEIALISSHAPWTPIPALLPWEALGDGRVFDAMAQAGPTPQEVWGDLERVRDQFAQAIDYSLRTVGAFAERRAGAEAPLMIVLGDHQPATFVTREDTGRNVPIHLIGPPEAVARLDGWGWTPGLIAGPDAPVWGMAAFRDRFVAAFGPRTDTVCLGPGTLPKAHAC